ncbi:MAG: hypothetical protein JF608_09910 [Sphingomonadales bacterium]|jgi:hypothetical protein|nr:hypothetical protein [Sphingomonadales bacterium]
MDDMSEQALGAALDRFEVQVTPESTPAERDWIELTVRRVSRVAGYLALAAAVAGIAYLVIR